MMPKITFVRTVSIRTVSRRGLLHAALLGAAVLAGSMAGVQVASAQTQKLSVVATTGMIADMARNIGGDSANVTGLLGPGVDPHTHRMTQTDISAMTRAELVLWHGLNLEAQMNDFMRDLAKRKRVVAVGETVPKDLLLQDEEDKTQSDPHIWMDPSLWSRAVNAVRDAMIAARPQARVAFEANAARHLKEIEAVAAYARQVLATVPQERRAVISAHDAFGYFGRLHGFDVIGIQGISTESEAGVAKIRELVELTVSRKIPAIFVETSVSDRNVQAVIEGAKARGHALKIGGELFSDALGAAGAYEGTYIGMVDHNATVIARALGGQAPARGMNGKLAEPGS